MKKLEIKKLKKTDNISITHIVVTVKAGHNIIDGIKDAINLSINSESDVLVRAVGNETNIIYRNLIDPLYAALNNNDDEEYN